MNKIILLMIIAILFWAGTKGFQKVGQIPKRDLAEVDPEQAMLIQDIVKEAKSVLNRKINDEEDVSNGPCLLNPSETNPDWVADVAHDPRTEVDDKTENQCQTYKEGKAKHFIEVNETGELIRFN